MLRPLVRSGPVSRLPWGIVLSVGTHALVGALLLLFARVRPLEAPAEQQPDAIAVEIVAPPEPVTTGKPAPQPAPAEVQRDPGRSAPPGTASASTSTAKDRRSGMLHATQFFAAGILREPASRKLRQTLSTFADSERIVQLCNMEGIEQIRRADRRYDPDVVVSYALADTTVDGLTLSADGGAFHSGRGWYGLRFRCTVSARLPGCQRLPVRHRPAHSS